MPPEESPPSKSASVVSGPRVGRWHCPVCDRDVPRLLPNGRPNRTSIPPEALRVDHSDVETTVEKFAPEAPVESCLSCRDAIQTLVGNLIRPPAEHGDARSGPGLNDTGIVGAVLPVPGTSAQILIFHVVNGHLRLTEREHLNDLEEARLTYPGSRGAIAPLMWSLYEAHLVQLHAALDETS